MNLTTMYISYFNVSSLFCVLMHVCAHNSHTLLKISFPTPLQYKIMVACMVIFRGHLNNVWSVMMLFC